ncbi:MAG: hypothetical protein KBC73_17090 [Burkholderiaceae bacterium]|nr:hypothetical protein [Burkholderiaceae bacterium]
MIVRPRPHWLHLLFVRRGSLLGRILPQQLAVLAIAMAVAWAHGRLWQWKVPLNAGAISLMGVSLAIFLGFRINASYDRYWEARKLWGLALIASRNLARHLLTALAVEDEARPLVRGLMAFAAAMRNQLRGQPATQGLDGLLPAGLLAVLPQQRSAPLAIALWLGRELQAQRRDGKLETILAKQIEDTLDELLAAWGGCERIAATPLPFTYSVILHRSVYTYCLLLPFGLVDGVGLATPLVVGFVSYTFFALESLSDEIEEPFGQMPNDLPLDALVAGIQASLLQLLGETPPPAPQPDDRFVLR